MIDVPATTNFKPVTDDDGIVWLHFDKADSTTNTLTIEILQELDGLLQKIAAQCPRGLIILSDKNNGFIAGADIKSLISSVHTEQQALDLLKLGQGVFNRLAAFTVPTVALIHGFCLGGGTELALACRYRVARDDPGTRLGLPEVRLGIHPGWGGSVRLPQLIGSIKAMDLILSGRTIDGRRAKRFGLVNQIVPERHLKNAARKLVLETPPSFKMGFIDRLSNSFPARQVLAVIFRQQVAKRASKLHYPAPYAMIDVWQKYTGDVDRMQTEEARSFARLVTGSVAKNLVRVYFLQEQLKDLGRDKSYQPKHIHVIGAGAMGGDIASWCALQGFRVTLQDQSPERIAPAIKRARALYQRKLKNPRIIQAAMDRLVPDHRGTGIAQADIVIEAIFEDIEVKRSLYRDIEPRMKPDAILATNTSSIPLEKLTPALSKPERLVGLHFFNPVAKMQLVEIVSGASTGSDVAAKAMTFTRRIDRLPLPVTSTPGFLVNRILMPYLMEAVILESEGVPAPLIDRAATDFGMPMGPVELADTVGLDICLHVAEILATNFEAEIPKRLEQLVGEGNLGRKSGRGFYSYKKGKAVKRRVSFRDWNQEDITNRLMLRMLNEAVSCLREGVVASNDLLDAGMIFATGFAPFRGGLMNYIDAVGTEKLLKEFNHIAHLRGPRFTPDPGWQSLFDISGGDDT
jgi:3-hydroxyacyl-CoA dehydrogenase/enoyl-CoA hydratase/3-hydroxybutyryl-CoA epimerase